MGQIGKRIRTVEHPEPVPAQEPAPKPAEEPVPA